MEKVLANVREALPNVQPTGVILVQCSKAGTE
jgi:hypothetical protein